MNYFYQEKLDISKGVGLVLGNSASWFYWAILDIFSVVLAWRAGSYVMVAQFIFWTLNTFYGFYKWYKSAKYENYVKIE